MSPDDILDLREASAAIRLSMRKLAALAEERKIEAVNLGRGRGNGLRFVRKHLIQYMENEASKNKSVPFPKRKGNRRELIYVA